MNGMDIDVNLDNQINDSGDNVNKMAENGIKTMDGDIRTVSIITEKENVINSNHCTVLAASSVDTQGQDEMVVKEVLHEYLKDVDKGDNNGNCGRNVLV